MRLGFELEIDSLIWYGRQSIAGAAFSSVRRDRDDFGLNRAVFGHLSYGLYIVTSINDSLKNGQIVNTVLQVTSEPPRVR